MEGGQGLWLSFIRSLSCHRQCLLIVSTCTLLITSLSAVVVLVQVPRIDDWMWSGGLVRGSPTSADDRRNIFASLVIICATPEVSPKTGISGVYLARHTLSTAPEITGTQSGHSEFAYPSATSHWLHSAERRSRVLSVGGGGEGFRRSPTVVTASEITPHEHCTDKSQYSECVHCVGDEGSHHPLLSYKRRNYFNAHSWYRFGEEEGLNPKGTWN